MRQPFVLCFLFSAMRAFRAVHFRAAAVVLVVGEVAVDVADGEEQRSADANA